ncbi:MAG: SDR family oxidoreductase [Herbiconiux sp.]|nr:SDR family oxidoreductase [Herbiconiux sp.]
MSKGVAVVTGGSAGLGRAIVRELADRGWDVAVLARGEDGLLGAEADVVARGRRGLGLSVDVADREAVEQAASDIEQQLGPIELWVNNAMTGVFGEFLDTEPDDFERAVAVDFFVFVNGTRSALSRMTPRDRGHVIQVGSALAHRGIPLQAAYCASKAAVRGFTESVTTELLHNHSKVTVSTVDMPALNTIQFNWVKTDLPDHPQPVPPIFEPELAARVLADVADKPRRRTWVGGSTVQTIVGARLAGCIVDEVLARTGYDGQQAPDKTEPLLPPNLYEPVAGDRGARGIFSDSAKSFSVQIWAIRHRMLATAAAVGAVGLAVASGAAGLEALRRGRSH